MHKGKAVPVGTLKAYGERMVQVHMLCNRAHDGVSSFTLVALPPMKGPRGTHSTRGCVGPVASRESLENT
jgi:hypothetical protein